LKDHVFHLGATQVLNSLLAQNPGDRVSDVALAAAVWPDNSSYSITSEDEVSVVSEGLKARDFEAS
jgi:hypothetical protein